MKTPPHGPISAADVSLLQPGDWLLLSLSDTVCPVRFHHAGETLKGTPLVFHDGGSQLFHRFTFLGRPDSEGWIAWSGGENPVPGYIGRIEVRLRSGDEFSGSDLTDDGTWRHIWGEGDIVAFRPAPDHVAPASSSSTRETFTVDELAQEIRRVDGNHDLGAGALAEALTPFLLKKLVAYGERASSSDQPEQGAWTDVTESYRRNAPPAEPAEARVRELMERVGQLQADFDDCNLHRAAANDRATAAEAKLARARETGETLASAASQAFNVAMSGRATRAGIRDLLAGPVDAFRAALQDGGA